MYNLPRSLFDVWSSNILHRASSWCARYSSFSLGMLHVLEVVAVHDIYCSCIRHSLSIKFEVVAVHDIYCSCIRHSLSIELEKSFETLVIVSLIYIYILHKFQSWFLIQVHL